MDLELTDKVAVVTGAGKGIGLAEPGAAQAAVEHAVDRTGASTCS